MNVHDLAYRSEQGNHPLKSSQRCFCHLSLPPLRPSRWYLPTDHQHMPATNFDKRKVSPLNIDFFNKRLAWTQSWQKPFREPSRVKVSIGASQGRRYGRAEQEQEWGNNPRSRAEGLASSVANVWTPFNVSKFLITTDNISRL